METATETNQTHRELTATEIQISIAQIQDRLMRVAKAQEELSALEEMDDGNELAEKIRAKYDIPEGVHLFSLAGQLNRYDVKTCKHHIASFVKGKLTEEGILDLIFFFEEIAECDYGWILVERPMGFYSKPSCEDMDDVLLEIKSIGTRSRLKNTKLPQIGKVFSPE